MNEGVIIDEKDLSNKPVWPHFLSFDVSKSDELHFHTTKAISKERY